MPSIIPGIVVLMTVVLVSGCAWQTQSRLERFNAAYNSANFTEAARLAAHYGNVDEETGASEDLLWTLQQARSLQDAGEHEAANRLFDTTESFFRLYDERGALAQWSDQLISVLGSDAALAYQGTVYDAIMVNSYKALNFLAQGQPALARVELNRARDRQRRAADYFAEELAEARREVIQRNLQSLGSLKHKERLQRNEISQRNEYLPPTAMRGPDSSLQQALSNADSALAADYDRLDEWSVYPDFINPFATYLQGLYLMTHAEASGDMNRAADTLREIQAMVPDNRVVSEDWQWAEALAGGKVQAQELPPTVWVIYENGLAPVRAEERIQLPVVLFNRNGGIFWAGIAYPVLKPRSLAQPALAVKLRSGEQAFSDVLVSMDAVIAAEFRERLPTLVTRAVVAAVAKAAAQYQLQKEAHPLVALLGFLYQVASTQADTRQWTSLPKTIEVAKLERSVQLDQLMLSGVEEQVVDLPNSRFTLVWVRQPTTGTAPAVTVIPLGAEPMPYRSPSSGAEP